MAQRSEVMVARAFYQMAMVTLLAALCWVGIGIYQAAQKGTDIGVDKELLTPVVPTIDKETIESLEQRMRMGGQTPIGDVTIENIEGVNELAN